jgi:hypothetical protein
MKRSLMILSAFFSALLVPALAGNVSAAQISFLSVSANWHDPTDNVPGTQAGDPVITNGVPTSSIYWGVGDPQSGYDFVRNIPGPQTLPPAPTPFFPLGTFTHRNFPINDPSLTSVKLDVVLLLNVNGVVTGPLTFTFMFTHVETPNDQSPCPYPTPPGEGCTDRVTFASSPAPTTFNVGGTDYTLAMSFVDDAGNPVAQFLTRENMVNTANLVGQFTLPPPPPSCGDGLCNGTDTCSNCPQDCGVCPPPPPSCGDGQCNGSETCSSCPQDCGVCPPPPTAQIQFDPTSYTVDESSPTATIRVTRTVDFSGTSSVEYLSTDGTATAGQDYVAVSGKLTFSPGDTVKTFEVPIINDRVPEGSETVNLNLRNPSGANLPPAGDHALLTITEQNPPPPPPPNPFISELIPYSKYVNETQPFTMRIIGEYFDAAGAEVIWNNVTPLTVLSRTSTEIDVTVNPTVWSNTPGTYPVIVRNLNPAADSNQAILSVLPVEVPTPSPVIIFSAYPTTITAGEPSTLKWTVSYATSAEIDQGVGTASLPSGSKSVTPANTTTYTLKAYGPGGAASAQVTVTVNQPPQPPAINYFTANPPNILQGEKSTLKWDIANATSAVIDQGIGTVSYDIGTRDVAPNTTIVYTLTAFGPGGRASAHVTVTVNLPPPTIQFSAATYSESESANAAHITVTRTGSDLSGTSTVQFATVAGGSGVPGKNYVDVLGTLIFDPYKVSLIFDVPLINDGLADGDKTVNLELSGASGATLGNPNTATLTITDVGAPNPKPPLAPFISELVPYSAPVNFGSDFTMRILGDGFDANAQVLWNGSGSGITVLTSAPTEIDVNVSKNLLTTAGQVPVVVVNPGNVRSNQALFTVWQPQNGGNTLPWIVSGPSADPNPTYFNYTYLNVTGASHSCYPDGGCLTYTWSLVSGPSTKISFDSNNGQLAGSHTKVTFPVEGVYRFRATITDTVSKFSIQTSILDVTVVRTAVSLTLSPKAQTITPDQKLPLKVTLLDQFGASMYPDLNWASSGGSLTASKTSAELSVEPLAQKIHITASLPNSNLSDYADVTVIYGEGGIGNLNQAKAYPVPCKVSDGCSRIHFANLPPGSTIRIFTTDARLVQTIHVPDGGNEDWLLRNSANDLAASGVYLYIIEAGDQKKEGKLVVIK